MKALNYVIIATLFTFILASCSQEEPLTSVVEIQEINIDNESLEPPCDFPKIDDSVCEIGPSTEMYAFSSCMSETYDDSELPTFEFEGEIYEYEPYVEGEEQLELVTAIMFYSELINEGLQPLEYENGRSIVIRDWKTKLINCLKDVSGIKDIKKLIKKLRKKKLSKKEAWRIAKKFIRRHLGIPGAIIIICELSWCITH